MGTYFSIVSKAWGLKPGTTLREDEKSDIFEVLNVLIVGLHHSGKSTLINTILRVLNKEWNSPYNFYANVGPISNLINGEEGHGTFVLEPLRPSYMNTLRIFDCKAANDIKKDEEDQFFRDCITKGKRAVRNENHNFTYVEDTACKIHVSVFVVTPYQLFDNTYSARLTELSVSLTKFNRKPIIVITFEDKMNGNEDADNKNEFNLNRCIYKAREICSCCDVITIQNYVPLPDIMKPIPYNEKVDSTVCFLLDKIFFTGDRTHVSDKSIVQNTN